MLRRISFSLINVAKKRGSLFDEASQALNSCGPQSVRRYSNPRGRYAQLHINSHMNGYLFVLACQKMRAVKWCCHRRRYDRSAFENAQLGSGRAPFDQRAVLQGLGVVLGAGAVVYTVNQEVYRPLNFELLHSCRASSCWCTLQPKRAFSMIYVHSL